MCQNAQFGRGQRINDIDMYLLQYIMKYLPKQIAKHVL